MFLFHRLLTTIFCGKLDANHFLALLHQAMHVRAIRHLHRAVVALRRILHRVNQALRNGRAREFLVQRGEQATKEREKSGD